MPSNLSWHAQARYGSIEVSLQGRACCSAAKIQLANSLKLQCQDHALPMQPPVRSKAWWGPGRGHFYPMWDSSNRPSLIQNSPLGRPRLSDLHCSLMVFLHNSTFFPSFFSQMSYLHYGLNKAFPTLSCFLPLSFTGVIPTHTSPPPINVSHSLLCLRICFLEDPTDTVAIDHDSRKQVTR